MWLASSMVSRAQGAVRPLGRRVRGDENGFTMVEITVGIFLVTVGLMAVASSFDVFRALITTASHRSVAAHVADQELEKLATIGWKDLELVGNPGTSSDPKDPRSGVSGTQYRPDSATPYAALEVDTSNTSAVALSRSWSQEGASGTVYRFITKTNEAGCGTTCPKRVTVAVTINRPGSANPPEPVTASTVVSETQDKSADETTAPPPPPPGPIFETFFPSDTPALTAGGRQEPIADHIVHESNKFPDLLVQRTLPPNPNFPADPPSIRLFSSEYALANGGPYTPAGYPGGRVIKKENNCDNYGDRNKVQWWVTKPLASTVTLTGNIGGSVWAQVAGETAGNVILCLTVYEVVNPLKADGSFDRGSTKLNGRNCSGADIRITSASADGVPAAFPDPAAPSDPIAPREISWDGKFLGCNVLTQQVAAGHRVAIALTVRDKRPRTDAPVLAADIPANDAVVLFDHAKYDSSISLETTGTAPFIP